MKYLFSLLLFLFIACGEAKKTDEKKPVANIKSPKAESGEAATSLDELVYEAEGRSVIESEAVARSQAEIKGRAGLVRQLEEDAASLINGFMKAQPGMVEKRATRELWMKALQTYFNSKTLILKGSAPSDYEQSKDGDTLIVTMSLPLMNGYDVIERALVDVAKNEKFIQPATMENFKSAFREYYLNEKKKLLTMPS